MLGDLPPSFISCGRLSYSALCRAASTGSMPANGWQCSNSEYAIMENEYTSTCAAGVPRSLVADGRFQDA